MDKIWDGVRTFRNHVFDGQRELFRRLANRQDPMALFITCADSRINPNLITQTEPGDLFLLRNVGNIIPPYGAASGGEGATIEYAVSVLKVPNIVVCGHTLCGAMQALLNGPPRGNLPAVQAWFHHAESTRQIVQEKFARLPPAELALRAIEQNVLVQIGNLRTHPSVAVALARGELNIFGCVYHLENGEVWSYDPAEGRFCPPVASNPAPMPCSGQLSNEPGSQGAAQT